MFFAPFCRCPSPRRASAQAAVSVDQYKRVRALLAQADTIIIGELTRTHPFRAHVYNLHGHLAATAGDKKQAKLWRRKAEKLPEKKGWDRATVSIEELAEKP